MQSMEEYSAFLAEIRKQTGLESMACDDTGLVSLRVDDAYNVNLQFIKDTGKVLCFVEIMELPKDAPKAVYRDMLVGALFGEETAGGYFTLEGESETVIYNYFFDGAVISKYPEEFISTLEKILQLCDIWVERLSAGLKDSGSDFSSAKSSAPFTYHQVLYS